MTRQNLVQVCICIPTYNSEKTIAETLNSILRQSYEIFRIILVDNASTDNTLNIVQTYADSDKRISIIRNEKNIGAEANFTRCIEVASGDYTAIFHADDVYHSDIISKQVIFMEQHQDAGAVFTMARQIDAEGNFLGIARMPNELIGGGWDRTYCFEEIFKLILRDHNFIKCPSALVRTDIYKHHVSKWDGDRFASSADLWVWLCILEKYTIGILPEPLFDYRLSTSQGTHQIQHMRTAREDFYKVIDYYLYEKNCISRLDQKDKDNLQFLEFLDHYLRSVSYLILNDRNTAVQLTEGSLNPALFRVAFLQSPLDLIKIKMYVSALFIYILARLPESERLGKLLFYLKYRIKR